MTIQEKHNLPRTSPEQQGIASAAVLRFVEAVERQIHELHSFMLLRHGCVAAEGWWSPYARETPHSLYSLSKSFTSTAVGLAVSEGRFSIDDPVLSFFPEETPGGMNDHWAAMRVRHLLSMSTGHAVDTWQALIERPDGNWIRAFFDVPVLHAPGTHFLYNTGATYLLSAIVQKTTGVKLVDYLAPRLFEPLGIEHAAWDESPQGISTGGIGLNLTTEGIARFGQLYLQHGMWQGRQLVPEAWVAEAAAFQISNGDDPHSDWAQGYGYQFWRCQHGAYRGDGAFGQYCIIMPEQDAVLAITGGVDVLDMQPPLDLVWEILLPAMSDAPLADDPAAERRLADKLRHLSMPPVQGEAETLTASRIAGRMYRVDANALEVEAVALDFGEAGCTVRVRTAASEGTIACGHGRWETSMTRLFNTSRRTEPMRVAASGAWSAADTYSMVVRLVETPYYHTVVFHFDGDELLIETRVNVSFGPLETHLLSARAG